MEHLALPNVAEPNSNCTNVGLKFANFFNALHGYLYSNCTNVGLKYETDAPAPAKKPILIAPMWD